MKDVNYRDEPQKVNVIAKELKVSRHSNGRVVHRYLCYKTYVMRRGQFMFTKTNNNQLIHAKHLLSNLKHQELGMFSFFSNEKKNLDQDQKVKQ